MPLSEVRFAGNVLSPFIPTICSGFIAGMVRGIGTGVACCDTVGDAIEVTGLADVGLTVLVGDVAAELGSRTRVLCNSML